MTHRTDKHSADKHSTDKHRNTCTQICRLCNRLTLPQCSEVWRHPSVWTDTRSHPTLPPVTPPRWGKHCEPSPPLANKNRMKEENETLYVTSLFACKIKWRKVKTGNVKWYATSALTVKKRKAMHSRWQQDRTENILLSHLLWLSVCMPACVHAWVCVHACVYVCVHVYVCVGGYLSMCLGACICCMLALWTSIISKKWERGNMAKLIAVNLKRWRPQQGWLEENRDNMVTCLRVLQNMVTRSFGCAKDGHTSPVCASFPVSIQSFRVHPDSLKQLAGLTNIQGTSYWHSHHDTSKHIFLE